MTQPGDGRVLGGRYRLIREIARGGMATVWEAQDALLDRHVAVKLLHPHYADDAEFVERFRRESRAAARLSHPNIVSIYDVGEDAETHTPFIVMELVEGGNLKDRIRRAAPLADDEIRSIGAALASTLDYAHHRGIIHRDVKPQNVLLGDDGRPRLTDFGIAQAMAASGLTRTGAVMGSVHYLAPELARGKPAVPQSDLYSLGALMYEMATGRVPFEAETDLAVALAHAEETPAAPRALNARLAPDLERVIMRSLAKSPEQRFLSGAEMAAELRTGTGAQALAAATPARAAYAATQRMPSVPAAVAAPPRRARAPAAPPPTNAPARHTARPRPKRGFGGGVLALLLAMALVLLALGVGLFGWATFSREGLATPAPTPPPTAAATAVPKPVAVPTGTPQPAAPSPTPAPSPTAEPSPTPEPPTPSPVPSTPTAVPKPTAAPQPAPTPRAIAVPQLRGKTLEQAQVALRADGFTATVRGVNVNADKDVVADQSPEAGTALPPGTTVTVMVGTGFTAIPNVADMPRDQAIRALQSSSFTVVQSQRRDPRVPDGTAIETRPKEGTIAPRKGQVELIISSGR